MALQQTVKDKVVFSGIGLHSGKEVNMTVRPADAGTGVVFHRIDLDPAVSIEAVAQNVVNTRLSTTIGKGGAVIRQITEETGTTIDIENDGTVKIAAVDGAAGREAERRIKMITSDVEVGAVYEGRVARLMDFGAFVTILPGRDGLVHISQISDERVERVSDKLKEGDVIKVKVLEVDRQGRIRLSMRGVE